MIVQLFIDKGADTLSCKALYHAARGGHKDLVEIFISEGADNWNYGLHRAAQGGHKDLVEFFIEKGADDWNYGLHGAAKGGHKDLGEYLKVTCGEKLKELAKTNSTPTVVEFFIDKGADDWDYGIQCATQRGHKDLIEYFQKKLSIK